MFPDPITEEIRGIRHQLAERFDNDVDRIGDDLRRREADSSRRIARLPRRLPSAGTTTPMRDNGLGSIRG
jgi:hypothetical protein